MIGMLGFPVCFLGAIRGTLVDFFGSAWLEFAVSALHRTW